MKRNFKRAVAQARFDLDAVPMPAEAAERVLRAAKGGRRGPTRQRVAFVSMTAGAFAIAAAVVVAFHGTPAGAPRLPMPDGLEALAPSSDLQARVAGQQGAVEVDRGTLELRVAHWGRVVLHAGAALRRVEGGVELARGAAEFQVDKRGPTLGPTFVRTRLGTIEITGTCFFVTQNASGGSVRLDEGSIRFHAPDGRTVALVPGQSLTWPLPPATAPAPTPAVRSGPREQAVPLEAPAGTGAQALPSRPLRNRGVAARAKATATDDEMIDRIATLRATGRYAELAEELAAAIGREPRARTRERLSFELGSALSYHLDDRARACAHWAEHLRRFPAGRYTEEATHAAQSLRCDDTKGAAEEP